MVQYMGPTEGWREDEMLLLLLPLPLLELSRERLEATLTTEEEEEPPACSLFPQRVMGGEEAEGEEA
jgi:hypothetical protein